MTTYAHGQNSPYGLYISVRPLDMRFVGAEGERLEGKAGAAYGHVPGPLALLLAPVFGGLFVLTFPFVVLAALLAAFVEPVVRRVRRGRRS